MPSLARLVVVGITVLALSLAPARARADFLPNATSIAEATGYILPVGCAAVTGTYHLIYLSVDEGAPRAWRTAAYICGGVSLGIGTYVLASSDDLDRTRLTVGIVPLVLGTYAIVTAFFVGEPDDIVGAMARAPHVTPWLGAGSAGLAWSGTF